MEIIVREEEERDYRRVEEITKLAFSISVPLVFIRSTRDGALAKP